MESYNQAKAQTEIDEQTQIAQRAEIASQKFSNISTEYDNKRHQYDQTATELNNKMSILEERGNGASATWYSRLAKNEESSKDNLIQKRASLIKELNDSVKNGDVAYTPYALQEDKSFNIELSDALESDIVFTSDVYGYIDADYVITVKEAGNLKFNTYYYNPNTESYTLDREFTVQNCITDEKIYVKGDTQLVTSSRTVHELGKDCNFILPRIVNTYQSDDEEVRNKIKSNLKCNVQITYNPTAMIGYGYKS